jgi:hypothetical protein
MNQKHYLLENIISEDRCTFFEKSFFDYLNNNGKITESKETVKNMFGEALGICDVISKLKLHNFFIPILKDLKDNIKYYYNEQAHFSHSFARIYYNNSILPIHIDDPKFDVTFSINIGGLDNWAFYVSNIELQQYSNLKTRDEQMNVFSKDCDSFFIKRGSAVLTHGRKYPHWRNQLQCSEGDYMLQLFLHFTLDDMSA